MTDQQSARVVFHGRDLTALHGRVGAGEEPRQYRFPLAAECAGESFESLRAKLLERISHDSEDAGVIDVWEGPLTGFALEYAVLPHRDLTCDVNWGSHGCKHPRGHAPEIPHECDCCTCEHHPDADSGCVAKPPYYGEQTRFYGEDAEALGLPLVSEASRSS